MVLHPIATVQQGGAGPAVATVAIAPQSSIGIAAVPVNPPSVAPYSTWTPGGDLSQRFDASFPNMIQPGGVINPGDPFRMPDAASMDAWRQTTNADMYSTGSMYDWQSPLPFATSGVTQNAAQGGSLGGLSGTPVNNPSVGNSAFGSPAFNLNNNSGGLAATAQGMLGMNTPSTIADISGTVAGVPITGAITSGSWLDKLTSGATEWFYRGIVIGLGFILVAIGVGMFKNTQTVVASVKGMVGK